MKEVAESLNEKLSGEPARFHYVAEYYDYASVRRFIQENGVPEQDGV